MDIKTAVGYNFVLTSIQVLFISRLKGPIVELTNANLTTVPDNAESDLRNNSTVKDICVSYDENNAMDICLLDIYVVEDDRWAL